MSVSVQQPAVVPRSPYTIAQTVNEIMVYFEKAGTESYLGPQEESVTQLSHSLQAAQQARVFTSSSSSVFSLPARDVILAALLHDIGHMILSRPDSWDASADTSEQHEWVGFHYLQSHGFSPAVAQLVLGHVQAKRYLTFAEPGYHEKLSDSSRMTLIGQGGPMSAQEAADFEKDPLKDVKLRMRVWDEEAKIVDWQPTGHEMEEYRQLITQHLEEQEAQRTETTTAAA